MCAKLLKILCGLKSVKEHSVQKRSLAPNEPSNKGGRVNLLQKLSSLSQNPVMPLVRYIDFGDSGTFQFLIEFHRISIFMHKLCIMQSFFEQALRWGETYGRWGISEKKKDEYRLGWLGRWYAILRWFYSLTMTREMVNSWFGLKPGILTMGQGVKKVVFSQLP